MDSPGAPRDGWHTIVLTLAGFGSPVARDTRLLPGTLPFGCLKHGNWRIRPPSSPWGLDPQYSGRREQRRRLLGLSPREAVDDAALAGVAGDETRELALPLAFHLHRKADVRPVEAEREVLDRAADAEEHELAVRVVARVIG